MKFQMKRKKDFLVVGLSGELDHHNAKELRENVDIEILGSGARGLVFDFSKLDLMDSSGIGVIMGRYKLMEELGGHVCVSGAKTSIKKVILLSGLGKLIGLCDTVDDAVNILEEAQ